MNLYKSIAGNFTSNPNNCAKIRFIVKLIANLSTKKGDEEMGYYRRGNYQFGSTRLIVKLEHLLFAGILVVILSAVCLLISSVIQLGYADIVNAAFQSLMSLLAAIPWYVFLATLLIGILFLKLAGGKGE